MEQIKIIRVAQGKNSTLSHLYIGSLFCCYLLEDSIRMEKIQGLTCISEGEYLLRLNTWAGMNLLSCLEEEINAPDSDAEHGF